MPQNVVSIVAASKVSPDRVEIKPFADKHEQQHRLMSQKQALHGSNCLTCRTGLTAPIGLRLLGSVWCLHLLRNPSAITASRMTAPWIAFSQYACTCRYVRAGLMQASRSKPRNAPNKFPRPPDTATPPTTAAAIALSSRPEPDFGSTCGDCSTFMME